MSALARLTISVGLGLLAAAPACAGDLDFVVRTPSGSPAPNAVVSVYPATGSHAPTPGGELVMAQKDIAFAPYILIAPLAGSVSFPNRDTVRHHVYSFSPIHRFELKLYGREEHRAEVFDKPGPVPIGCNIHDKMAAYIYVTDTRFVGKTDAQGHVRIAGLPAGSAQVKVWHAFAKTPGGMITQTVALNGGDTTGGATLDLRPPPPGKQDH